MRINALHFAGYAAECLPQAPLAREKKMVWITMRDGFQAVAVPHP
jgi:hypothetical protein